MKKWMLMLCFLLFFDVQMIGGMRDIYLLEVYRQSWDAGGIIPESWNEI